MPDTVARRSTVPKIIWTLWLQGWDRAPQIVSSCLRTWRKHNVGWDIRALSLPDIVHVLNGDPLISLATSKDLRPEAFSDAVRIALLRRYGGVWIDSTCYCLKPLDEWLHDRLPIGFFAFANPRPDRMLSSWFLAAVENNYIVEKWYDLTFEYWSTRSVRDHYFWFHELFAVGYGASPQFRAIWDGTPKLSADGPHYYAPYEKTLLRRTSCSDFKLLECAPTPLLKLTRKVGATIYPEKSVLNFLVQRANADPIHLHTKMNHLALSLFRIRWLLRNARPSRVMRSMKLGLGLRAKFHRARNEFRFFVSNTVGQWRGR